ncbi:hypothetical protein H112_00926 [Trichophyton rubrum D6]|uniref:Uncharacterized protein n=3 Tax=Trichophyton TaxID=5550 RepID=A0A080WPW1_TRIRC|nr:uncharacterized protein TERG_12636 [Trichophyton rubrum CBS 118892]EZF27017.1 hypothetical protein H100_00923 [Trichophyton rubrum MR850]EZF46058.1 hypothetical protein H102_00916 [Trichophyton rubrum CBS 100081]EZF56704.1 hypothetical protein H103_00924 [Trichophyton rubrum CBS 288.86]EZF67315.1 hypothetical protein H104_00908 [Trichophyton rubrum CBS 289.86]EZF77973.1 hypothetical protein H105_00923 [Trichophyton soudanense CBS 452.61]EZF88616.1 hypothetical protein H110_00925 [Trichophy
MYRLDGGKPARPPHLSTIHRRNVWRENNPVLSYAQAEAKKGKSPHAEESVNPLRLKGIFRTLFRDGRRAWKPTLEWPRLELGSKWQADGMFGKGLKPGARPPSPSKNELYTHAAS